MKEIWKSIPGFRWYEASNLGAVKSIRYDKIKILRPHYDARGYARVVLYTGEGRWSGVKGEAKCLFVHRAVWLAFMGSVPDGMEIDHIDHDPSKNHLENLQVLTRDENMAKAWGRVRASGRTWIRRKAVSA